MLNIGFVDMISLVATGFGLATVCLCCLFVRVASSQRGKVGIFVLAAIFCCFMTSLLLWVGLA